MYKIVKNGVNHIVIRKTILSEMLEEYRFVITKDTNKFNKIVYPLGLIEHCDWVDFSIEEVPLVSEDLLNGKINMYEEGFYNFTLQTKYLLDTEWTKIYTELFYIHITETNITL